MNAIMVKPVAILLSAAFLLAPKTRFDVLELVDVIKDSRVEGYMLEQSVLRADKYDDADAVALVPACSPVEVLRDYGETWYLVRHIGTDKQGWVKREKLEIPPDEPTDTTVVDSKQIENYANAMNYDSESKYLVIVDIGRQQMHVLAGARRKWGLSRTITVSTGRNESPTIRGEFSLSDRGLWFYSDRLGSGGKFWVRIQGPYLFHSVAMDRDGGIIDDTLGKKSSSGCVRMSLSDAEWFYKHVPEKTKIIIK